MDKIDAFLLDRIERFAHWFQRLTGLTNFWWARQMRIAFLMYNPALALAFVIRRMESPDVIPEAFLRLVFLVAVAYMLIWILVLRLHLRYYEEMDEYYRSGADTAHPMTLRWRTDSRRLFDFAWGILLFWVMVVPPTNVFFVLVGFFWYCNVACLYFEGCVPLPPSKSLVRQWVEALKARLVPVHTS